MKLRLLVLLGLALVLLALQPARAGADFTIEEYPAGIKAAEKYLQEIRRDFVQEEATGPHGEICLLYKDRVKDKQRTFLFAARGYRDPDGEPTYALFLGRIVNGKMQLMNMGASLEFSLEYGDEGVPPQDILVYDRLNAWFLKNATARRVLP